MTEPILEMRGITKDFEGVHALSEVDLSVTPGEILALVGENGAGKSTLMKILGGVVEPTAGRIVLDGRDHDRLTVAASIRAGIAFVHQELSL
ncbi:MAG: sugar ABC transporter ATP-binding protein, partial [Candidatus Omnitrophica bacterium]|nr:sugar ABC transporter ATP-binding protein [Candidatus Omnitrophota bacterium]